MNIRILLADDHKMIREGLGKLIAEQPGMNVIAQAEDGVSAARLAAELSPDIIVMDISMPGLNGIEATRRIKASGSATKVIALSMHLNRRMVLNMLDAGAAGYVLKDCASEELIHAIEAVAANRTYLSSQIIDLVVNDYKQQQAKSELPPQLDLTPLGQDVLRLVAEGRLLKEIAAELKISIPKAESLCQEIIHEHIAPHVNRSRKRVVDGERGGERVLSLTAREKEILLLIKDGTSTADMSLQVGVSQATIKFHLQNVYQKFNTNSRAKAVMIAIEHHLIEM